MTEKAVRTLLPALALFLLYILENTPLLLPPLWGAKPLLLVAAALSLTGEEVAAATVWGAVCGLLTDLGGGIPFFAVALTVVCCAQSALLHSVFRNRLPSLWLLSLGAVALLLTVAALLHLLTGTLDRRVPLMAGLTYLCVLPLSAILHAASAGERGEE